MAQLAANTLLWMWKEHRNKTSPRSAIWENIESKLNYV